MKRILSFLVVSLLFTPLVNAEIDGKKVIYLHGLQTKAFTTFSSNRDQILEADAQAQAGAFLRSRFDDFIYYDSAQRLSANSSSLFAQVKRIEQAGTCRDGCYLFTASTGDLVGRYVMSRLGQWGVDRNKFRILLTFDLVGAGGGTEGADTIVAVTQGNPIASALGNLLGSIFVGGPLNFNSVAGIINDLRPSIARRTSTQANVVPRLRIAGGKTTFLISALLKGGDDGVVPLHSACGSAVQESIDSCSRSIRIDGRVASADGPRNLWYNHFPIVMGEDLAHTDSDYRGKLVAINNGRNFGFFRYNVAEKTRTTGWWIFKKTFRTVDKPSSKLAVEFLINEIEN